MWGVASLVTSCKDSLHYLYAWPTCKAAGPPQGLQVQYESEETIALPADEQYMCTGVGGILPKQK